MAEKKAEYRSSIRSKKLIRTAFLELIQEKPVSRITVTDIVKRADVNRSTFYAHFPDVHGVIESFEDDTIEKMMAILSEFKYKNFFQNPLPALLRINRYLEDDMDFYKIMIVHENANLFFRKLSTTFIEYMKTDSDIPQSVKESVMFEMRINFFSGGILRMYEQWFLGNLNGELNDISIEVAKIITSSSENFFI